MKTEVVLIDNKKARIMLKQNISNRPLRRGKVDAFHDALKNGEFRLTHQGVAFDINGILKDGQHRLVFISELPDGVKVPMNVTTGMAVDTFGAIDRGAVRTISDEMGINRDLSAVAAILAKIYNSNQSHSWSIQYISNFVRYAEPEFSELVTYCPKAAQLWSSAPVRSAAVIGMKMGSDPDFVKENYRSLCYSDFSNMTPSAQSLVKQSISGKIVSARSFDLFCRAMRVFDSRKPHTNRLQIASMSDETKAVREFMFSQLDVPKLIKTDSRKGSAKQ